MDTGFMQKMQACQVILLLLLFELGLSQHRRITGSFQIQKQCKSVDEIPMCAGIGYPTIGLPNFRHQDNVNKINDELDMYNDLISSNCSNALAYLLCSIYAPQCYDILINNVYTIFTLPPCRDLCEQAYLECREIAADTQYNNLPHGQQFDCSNYPTKQEAICFGPEDPSTLAPMKVKKICDYQVTEIKTNSAVITKNEMPSIKSISCSPPILNITIEKTIRLSKLDQNTHYNCKIHHDTATDQQCTVELTTLPLLNIQLRNDTPDITNNSIHLEFETNKKVTTLECHLLSTTNKKDCINGTVLFDGLSPGYYTIRIVAETSDGEKATLRVRARVLQGPGYCTVNFINQQWALNGNELSVWFEGHPKQNQTEFECKVNKELFDCPVDPSTLNVLWTVPLTKGKNRVQISPILSKQLDVCTQRRYPRTITVTV